MDCDAVRRFAYFDFNWLGTAPSLKVNYLLGFTSKRCVKPFFIFKCTVISYN